ncbi:hypothetical protein AcW1_006267 [Taiwanofungus camphoratus]|nr:hypothetical protein AcW2_005023 [Antrodia cinnamomea]KAI0958090.1 hypothetical protein AcW1_006267 [Antrodia cinnamomea]
MSTLARVPTNLPPLVDSPETQRALKFPFVPIRRKVTRADFMGVLNPAPFDSLPLALVPHRKQSMKPPMMHFGWLVKADDLLRYAKEHQIQAHSQDMWGSDGEEDLCDDDDDDEEEAGGPHVDTHRTMEDALSFMAGRLGLQFPTGSLRIELPLRDDDSRIVSLYTNYLFKNIPPEDAIKAFGKELAKEVETDEVPRWHVDAIDWCWQ